MESQVGEAISEVSIAEDGKSRYSSDKHKDNRGKNKDSRKKDEKSVEHVLKTISNLTSTDEKFSVMCKKYAELAEEHKRQQTLIKNNEKQLLLAQKQRDQLQAENSKCLLTRSRLESLCRELQKQNKAMKEETMLRIREEEEKRKEVSGKFQSTLTEITSLMHQNSENNTKLRDENIDMQNKFKGLCEQYELREKQVEQMTKQMKLESQLADARMKKTHLEMVAEKEVAEKEKAQLRAEIALLQGKCVEQEKTEVALRAQIRMYVDKYDDFQNVLARSNQVYSGFKGEMEKMSKKITRLEKETSSWKLKWENSHQALLRMAVEKQKMDAEATLITKQLSQMQKLCRTLQAERTALLQQLKSEGLVPQLPERRLSAEKETQPPVNNGQTTEKMISPSNKTKALPLLNEVDVSINKDDKHDTNNNEQEFKEQAKDSVGNESNAENAIVTTKLEDITKTVISEISDPVSESQDLQNPLNANETVENAYSDNLLENLNEKCEELNLVNHETISEESQSTNLTDNCTESKDNSDDLVESEVESQKVEKSASTPNRSLVVNEKSVKHNETSNNSTNIALTDGGPPVAEPRKKNKEGKRQKK